MSRGDERQQKSLEWQFLSRADRRCRKSASARDTNITGGWLGGRFILASGLDFLPKKKSLYYR